MQIPSKIPKAESKENPLQIILMKISVLFFGQTAEIVGRRDIEISLNKSIKSGEVLAGILATHPKLKETKLLFAINQDYANGDEMINDGDELAIFTAVSGG